MSQAALAAVQFKENAKRHERHQGINPIEFLDNSFAEHSQLGQEDERMIDDIARICLFILTAGEGMKKPSTVRDSPIP